MLLDYNNIEEVGVKGNYNSLHFVLSKRIVFNSFTGAIVYGEQRLGKTSYAFQVMFDVYRDWERVFDRTFFRLEDIISFLKDAVKHDELIPVILWDDASVYGSANIYFRSREHAMYIQALFDVAGSKVRSILLTTPNPESLLKSIRSYEFYRVKITKANSDNGRVATGYKSIMLPSSTRNIRKEFKDYYNQILPNNVYERYNILRQGYLVEAIQNLDKSIVKARLAGERGMSLKEQILEEA